MKNTQLYREMNKKICDLVQQGKSQEAMDRFNLGAAYINKILKANNIPDRVKIETSYILDIQYY
jgi:hypothetical protein